MPYVLSSNTKRQYSHLTYSGTVSIEERQQAKTDVINNCLEKNFHRSLVDLREIDIKISESDAVKFANSFKDTGLPENYRLACLISGENKTENLIEIIIALDGINIKYFLDFDEAESWLTAL